MGNNAKGTTRIENNDRKHNTERILKTQAKCFFNMLLHKGVGLLPVLPINQA